MRTLLASLGDYSMAMLRGIAELRGVMPATNVREEVAAQLAGELAGPHATSIALSRISAEAGQAWAALCAAGGHIKVPAFTREYGAIRAIGPGRLEREFAWRQPETPAEELWFQGLIFKAFADLGAGLLEYFYIPGELLPRPATAEETVSARATAAPALDPPARSRQSGNALAVDVCTLLAALTDSPLRVGESGRWRAADEARIRERLLLPDPTHSALLLALAQQSGWLAVEQDRLVVQGPAVTAWLRASHWEQVSALFSAWQHSATWNDLRHISTLKAEGTWRNDPLAARSQLLAALGRLDPASWYSVEAFASWIKATEPDFQRPDGNYTDWYLRDVASERYLSGFEAWNDVEGRLIAFLIAGPLFWLGALSLAGGDGEPVMFRLTTGGAYWLAGSGLPEPYPPARLLVNEDFSVGAPLLVPLFDRFRLLRFTEAIPGPSSLDQPTQHRITRHSLSAARTRGLRGEKIVQFLRHASGGQLPARVETALLRWEQHGGAVRINKGAVLRVQDASMLAALRADPVIAPLLGELLSAQAALVKEADLPRLLAALAELGYTTRVE
jgi:Helicase conserved C-terminal domain